MNPLPELSPVPILSHVPPPKVELVNPLEMPDWDELLQTHPDYTFFHGSAWARVLCEAYDCIPQYLILRDEERLRALLPVMEIGSLLRGRRGVSLPFSDECAPLLSEGYPSADLLSAVLKLGARHRWKYWESHGGREFLGEAQCSLSFYGHRLKLDSSEKRLFEKFDGPVRRAIRKAERSDLKVEVTSSLESLKAFYGLHCLTRKTHGLPPQPFSFFRCIHKHVLEPGQGFVVLVRAGNKPVAAGVYFQLGGKVLYKFGASNRCALSLRPNNLVMWEAIKRAIRNGLSDLDFGRTDLANAGLRRFKRSWGAEEHLVCYFKYDYRKQQYVKDRKLTLGWHNQVFRLMPVQLARVIGALLYRHMA